MKFYTGVTPECQPPQDHAELVRLMRNLEQFINDDGLSDADPLVKMAVIHHQFESIHPFYEGNGRTGRIINILYLVAKGLLNIPVLYLSRYVIRTKSECYRLLQQTRDTGDWEPWILYMLQGVQLTARQTIWIIGRIKALMMDYKHRIRAELPKIYSQDLLNNLFRHPYTKIGRYNYYINFPLMQVFTEIPDQPEAFDAPAMDSG